ncbi:MAG: 6-phospho-beta-glucosidase [Chloroflexi bacterium]|nr:6-phospho-beta-glucosidase [Chloroflexota bacterium]
MKLAVVGGGSTYTPELIEGIARRAQRLPVSELVLLDIDPERLDIVGGLAGRMLHRLGWPGRLVLTQSQDEALEGANFVLVQLRVGGQAARLVDETLPPTYGTIGQETTGAGGFAKALRTVPLVLSIAEEVGRRAAPGAWIVDFTNPVGIVTQALLDEGHRAIGLCNVAIGFQREFAKRYGVEPERVELEHVGLNHLSWERAIKVDGVDRLPEILAGGGAEEIAGWVGSPAELVRITASIPSYYLKYYYRFDEVLGEQIAGKESRAAEVMDIEDELLVMYRNPSLDEKPKLLERRGGAFYSEAAAQLIASLHDGRGDVQVVDIRNGPRPGDAGPRALPDLPDDAVVEVPARITREGASPLSQAALAPDMLGLVQAVKAYERLTISAARSGDRALALRALMANPLVARWSMASPLLDALLDANRRYLPRFFAPA